MPEPARRIAILGSTGSVGTATLDVLAQVEASGQFPFAVEALVARTNSALLAEQARRFRPSIAVVEDEAAYPALRDALSGTGIACAAGHRAVIEAAGRGADWTMSAIVGAAGLAPTLAAVKTGGTVALANKETLVCAGPLFMDAVRAAGATLLPVDSEHNAIFQVFDAERPGGIEKIEITASGGPFRTWTAEAIAAARPEQALKHPNWTMGRKITIDSATLMNKGLELIEASILFGLGDDRLDVLVHPESIVHCLVHYTDGAALAQLGAHDMRIPIAHSLGWPERLKTASPRLDLAALGRLTFDRPDLSRFGCLGLARASLRAGGAAPAILNAANEVAVEAFLAGRTSFPGIAAVVEACLDADAPRCDAPSSLDEVLAIDARARATAARVLAKAA
jgi:1-deoxy-D-xylulose-5-phosphate reductoisomerase